MLGFTWNIKETFDIGLFGWYPFRYPENTPPKAGVDYYMQDAWCAFDNKLVTIYDGFRRSQVRESPMHAERYKAMSEGGAHRGSGNGFGFLEQLYSLLLAPSEMRLFGQQVCV